MSERTAIRTVNVRIKDDLTPYLMAIGREMRSVSREIHFLKMAFKALGDEELIAAAAEGDFIAIAKLSIPVIGAAAAAVSIGASTAILAQRGQGIIPVGQTRPGEVRQLTTSGPVWGHAGESLGRLGPPERSEGAGGGFQVNVDHLTLARDGEDPESIGRTFSHIRAGVLSTDIPASAILPLLVGSSSLFGLLQARLCFSQPHILSLIGIVSILGVCIWRGFQELLSRSKLPCHHVLHKCDAFSFYNLAYCLYLFRERDASGLRKHDYHNGDKRASHREFRHMLESMLLYALYSLFLGKMSVHNPNSTIGSKPSTLPIYLPLTKNRLSWIADKEDQILRS